MTKKANCILIRTGQNLFWQYKKSNFFIVLKFRKLLAVCQLELTKLKFLLLNINLVPKSLHIYVYIPMPKTIKFNLFLFYLLKNKVKNSSSANLDVKKLSYLIKKYIIFPKLKPLSFFVKKDLVKFKYLSRLNHLNTQYIFILCLNFGTINFSNYFLFLHILISSKKFSYSFLNPNLNNIYCATTKRVTDKIYFTFLRFKKQEVFLEHLVYKLYHYAFNIFLNNMLNSLQIEKFSNLMKKKFIPIFKSKDRKYNLLLFIFFSLKQTELIIRFFGHILLKTKKHTKNINIFIKKIYLLYLNSIINFKGCKMYISGKLNGKMKRQKYSFKMGDLRINTFKTHLSFFFLPLYTKYGIFSIKFWLNY